MNIEYYKYWSGILSREVEFKVYGWGGVPVLFIPCQGGRFYDFENFGMLDCWRGRIEAGKCTIFSIDTIDNETYADANGNPRRRTEQHERWYNSVISETVPKIKEISRRMNGYDSMICTFGCSLGGLHAANFFFRRPDIFRGTLALSGVFDSGYYFGDYMDDILYNNSPAVYLSGMPAEHPYIKIYGERKIIAAVGQGAWEEQTLASTRRLDRVLAEKGIRASINYWGFDVNHDWNWWFLMVDTYADELLS
ncbi:MAG: esterase [Firmicutes bacterium]|nr:esterase [Bacillota bacterium]MCD7783541.1 esterase [Bacillota bacterium]